MLALPAGLATDIVVLTELGATVRRNDDHLVVRSPENPAFHWGNLIVVTDAAAVDDAQRWDDACRREFPHADWGAIALIRAPGDHRAWNRLGFTLTVDEALTARSLPRAAPLPAGYEARRLNGDDWARATARAVAENDRTRAEPLRSFRLFADAQTRARRAMSDRDAGAFFGAFAADDLVASLGIVRCGLVARYQAVVTDEEHRGRGLASHLLFVAARWAHDRGCDTSVIVTEATNPAGRLYRRAGFEPDVGTVQAYRRPPSSSPAVG